MDEDSDGGRDSKGSLAVAFNDSLSSTSASLNFNEVLTSEINYGSNLSGPPFAIAEDNPIYNSAAFYEQDVNIRSDSFNSSSLSQLCKSSGVGDCDISASTSSDISFSDNTSSNVSVQKLSEKEFSSYKYGYDEINSSNSYLFPNKNCAIRTLSSNPYPSDFISNDKIERIVDNRIASNKRRLGNNFSVGAPAPKIKKKRLNVLESKPSPLQVSENLLQIPPQTSDVASGETFENLSLEKITEPINSLEDSNVSAIPKCKTIEPFISHKGNASRSSDSSEIPLHVQSSDGMLSNIEKSTLSETPDIESPFVASTRTSSLATNISINVSNISRSSLVSNEIDHSSLGSELDHHISDHFSYDANGKSHSYVHEDLNIKSDDLIKNNCSNSFVDHDVKKKLDKLQDSKEEKYEHCDNRPSVLRWENNEKVDFSDSKLIHESDDLSKCSKNVNKNKFVCSTLELSGNSHKERINQRESPPDCSITGSADEFNAVIDNKINEAGDANYSSFSNSPSHLGEPCAKTAMSDKFIESQERRKSQLDKEGQTSELSTESFSTSLSESNSLNSGSSSRSESSYNISSPDKYPAKEFSDAGINSKSKESNNGNIETEESSMASDEFNKDTENDEISKTKGETLHSKETLNKESKSTDEVSEIGDDQFKRLQQKRPGATGLSAKPKVKNLRRNIREIIGEDKLEENTLAAQKEEQLRLQRLQDKQQALRDYMEQQQVERLVAEVAEAAEAVTAAEAVEEVEAAEEEEEEEEEVEKEICGEADLEVKVKVESEDVVVLSSEDDDEPKRKMDFVVTESECGELLKPKKEIKSDDERLSDEESEISESDSDSDVVVLSQSEEEENESEDANNSGAHVNDEFNVQDAQGRVLVNVGHPENEEDIFLAPQLSSIVKSHQIGGIRFLYDNIIESVEQYKTSNGFGCILAHSMGLGKTLQVVAFTDIFLRHTDAKHVLIIVPINTLQNWHNEFNQWLPRASLASSVAEASQPTVQPQSSLNGQPEVTPSTGLSNVSLSSELSTAPATTELPCSTPTVPDVSDVAQTNELLNAPAAQSSSSSELLDAPISQGVENSLMQNELSDVNPSTELSNPFNSSSTPNSSSLSSELPNSSDNSKLPESIGCLDETLVNPLPEVHLPLADSSKESATDVLETPSIDPEIRCRTFNVFVLNDAQKNMSSRAKVITQWHNEGGVLLMGYELYRQLSLKKPKKPKGKKKRKNQLDDSVVDIEEEDKNKELLDEVHKYLVRPGPDLVICDEGHRIKNAHANISQALKNIRTKRRVVLTGYPLQNNLIEYWCMVDFVRPNYLGTKTEFCNMFERPIQNGQCVDSTPQDVKVMRYRAHVLHSLLEGFVQRRGHSVLAKSLPMKEEHVLLCRLTKIQRTLYTAYMNELKINKSVANPLRAFAICCKIWNHPDVLYNFVMKKVDIDLDLDELVGKTPKAKGRKVGKGDLSAASKVHPDFSSMTQHKSSISKWNTPSSALPSNSTLGMMPPHSQVGMGSAMPRMNMNNQMGQQNLPPPPPHGMHSNMNHPQGNSHMHSMGMPMNYGMGMYNMQQNYLNQMPLQPYSWGYNQGYPSTPSNNMHFSQMGTQYGSSFPSNQYQQQQSHSMPQQTTQGQQIPMTLQQQQQQQPMPSSQGMNPYSSMMPGSSMGMMNPPSSTASVSNIQGNHQLMSCMNEPQVSQSLPPSHPPNNPIVSSYPNSHSLMGQSAPVTHTNLISNNNNNNTSIMNQNSSTCSSQQSLQESSVQHQLPLSSSLCHSNGSNLNQLFNDKSTPNNNNNVFQQEQDSISDLLQPDMKGLGLDEKPNSLPGSFLPLNNTLMNNTPMDMKPPSADELKPSIGSFPEFSLPSTVNTIGKVDGCMEKRKEEKMEEDDRKEEFKKEELQLDWAENLLKNYVPGLLENSTKFQVFFKILEGSLKVGDRLLIFSQSLFTLSLLEEFLHHYCIPGTEERWAKNRTYFRLDGSTTAQEREKLINEFNVNKSVRIFLVSTRAGSLGINLVGANRVIVFDASFNPCHDTQAVCRVYRYGQQKPCHIYRLVTDNSLERRIYDRQVNKQGIADRIVDEMNPDAHLSSKEISNLLADDEVDLEAAEANATEGSDENEATFDDEVLQEIINEKKGLFTRLPFKHESLLVDRKDKKLSNAEKRLAKRSYELEKQANISFGRPSFYPKTIGSSQSMMVGTKIGGVVYAKPVGTVRPMQSEMGQKIDGGGTMMHRPNILGRSQSSHPVEALAKQGVSVQQITVPKDVSIPTNAGDGKPIHLKGGQSVMVIKTQKGIYLRLSDGKIIAIRTPPEEAFGLPLNQGSVTIVPTSLGSRGRGRGRGILPPTRRGRPPMAAQYALGQVVPKGPSSKGQMAVRILRKPVLHGRSSGGSGSKSFQNIAVPVSSVSSQGALLNKSVVITPAKTSGGGIINNISGDNSPTSSGNFLKDLKISPGVQITPVLGKSSSGKGLPSIGGMSGLTHRLNRNARMFNAQIEAEKRHKAKEFAEKEEISNDVYKSEKSSSNIEGDHEADTSSSLLPPMKTSPEAPDEPFGKISGGETHRNFETEQDLSRSVQVATEITTPTTPLGNTSQQDITPQSNTEQNVATNMESSMSPPSSDSRFQPPNEKVANESPSEPLMGIVKPIVHPNSIPTISPLQGLTSLVAPLEENIGQQKIQVSSASSSPRGSVVPSSQPLFQPFLQSISLSNTASDASPNVAHVPPQVHAAPSTASSSTSIQTAYVTPTLSSSIASRTATHTNMQSLLPFPSLSDPTISESPAIISSSDPTLFTPSSIAVSSTSSNNDNNPFSFSNLLPTQTFTSHSASSSNNNQQTSPFDFLNYPTSLSSSTSAFRRPEFTSALPNDIQNLLSSPSSSSVTQHLVSSSPNPISTQASSITSAFHGTAGSYPQFGSPYHTQPNHTNMGGFRSPTHPAGYPYHSQYSTYAPAPSASQYSLTPPQLPSQTSSIPQFGSLQTTASPYQSYLPPPSAPTGSGLPSYSSGLSGFGPGTYPPM